MTNLIECDNGNCKALNPPFKTFKFQGKTICEGCLKRLEEEGKDKHYRRVLDQ